jgi:hypothetical protein
MARTRTPAPGVPLHVDEVATSRTRPVKRRKPTTLEMLYAVGWQPIVSLVVLVAAAAAFVALHENEIAYLLAGAAARDVAVATSPRKRRGDR